MTRDVLLRPVGLSLLLIVAACQQQPDSEVPMAPLVGQESEVGQPVQSEIESAETTVENTHAMILENGLKVVVREDHRSPVVVSQVWYRVGGSNEPDGLTGISHVLEHMLFKGTSKYGPKEASRIIAENGGKENAFTNRDYTAYYQQWEKTRLPLSFDIESDRMRNLILSEEEFKKEVEVVKEERRMRTEDKPESFLYEAFQKAAYDVSPYRNPVIGWREDLDNMKVEDLEVWYQKYYAPNNAIVVVAGDVIASEVFALAEDHFGPLPAEDIANADRISEPAHDGERRIVVEREARVPSLIMGYQTPSVSPDNPEDWEPYALEVLAFVLDGGKSARFETRLVRDQQVAASIWTSYDASSRLDGMMMFGGTPAAGHSVEDLEQAIREQLEVIKAESVTQMELDRVKAQLRAGEVFEKDSIFGQAMNIGQLEAIGLGWELEDTWLERIGEVTAEQVMAVANKYLVDMTSTVAVLKPMAADGTGEEG
jgi:zinc protease